MSDDTGILCHFFASDYHRSFGRPVYLYWYGPLEIKLGGESLFWLLLLVETEQIVTILIAKLNLFSDHLKVNVVMSIKSCHNGGRYLYVSNIDYTVQKWTIYSYLSTTIIAQP